MVGISEKYRSFLELLLKRAELQLKYLKSGVKQRLDDGSVIIIRDRKLLVKLEMLNAQLKKYNLTGGKNITINQMLIKLGKLQGYYIKETEITVLDYHNLIAEYSDNGKENN